MKLKEKAKVLEQEINLIQDTELKTVAIDLLNRIPEYFYEIASSSSGKYHPQYALGDGGLVRHTKASIMIANSLLSLEMYSHIKQDRDYIIIALLIHDAFKRGLEYSDVTVNNHASLCAEWIDKNAPKVVSKNISQLVLTHMGQWNMSGDIEVAPKPQSEAQKFVHLCDYLASRKYLEVNFGEFGKMKNIDKIRQMTVEELAIFIRTLSNCNNYTCNECPLSIYTICENLGGKESLEHWLEKEVEE